MSHEVHHLLGYPEIGLAVKTVVSWCEQGEVKMHGTETSSFSWHSTITDLEALVATSREPARADVSTNPLTIASVPTSPAAKS